MGNNDSQGAGRRVLPSMAVLWFGGPPALLLTQVYQFITLGRPTLLTHGEQAHATWFLLYWVACFVVAPIIGMITAVRHGRHVALVVFGVAFAVSVFLSLADGRPWMLGGA